MSPPAPQSVTIRPYCAADLEETVALWYRSWHAAFPDLRHAEPIEEWRRRFETSIAVEEQVFVAEGERRRIVGFLAVADRGEGEALLHEIFVVPEYQRRGIGSLLMAKAKELAPAGLRLKTLQRNAQAIAFYERHGFVAGATGIGRVGLPNVEYRWVPGALSLEAV